MPGGKPGLRLTPRAANDDAPPHRGDNLVWKRAPTHTNVDCAQPTARRAIQSRRDSSDSRVYGVERTPTDSNVGLHENCDIVVARFEVVSDNATAAAARLVI